VELEDEVLDDLAERPRKRKQRVAAAEHFVQAICRVLRQQLI
jgi:hypothetical protein